MSHFDLQGVRVRSHRRTDRFEPSWCPQSVSFPRRIQAASPWGVGDAHTPTTHRRPRAESELVLKTSFEQQRSRFLRTTRNAPTILSILVALGTAGCNRGGGGDDGADTQGDTEGDTEAMDTEGVDETGATDDGGFDVEIEPAPGGMRRLLAVEYVDSIEMMLGAVAAEAALPAPDQSRRHFVAIGAQEVSLAAEAIEQYERSATAIADAVITDKTTLAETAPCVSDNGGGQACYEEVATELGRFAFRRSLSSEEVSDLVDLAMSAQSWGEGDFDTGLKYQLMAILQAPSFLYIMEVGEPDEELGYRRLTSTEMASRLSFFLLGRTPTLDLVELGENGGLETTTQIREVAEQMVASTRAREGLQKFTDELFNLHRLDDLNKTPDLFPLYSRELARFMREETQLFIIDLVWNEDGDARRLLDATYTFVNDPLAELYGMAPPGTGEAFAQTSWPAEQNRRGILSQASFLTSQSNPNRNSPIKRGVYVQDMLLCNPIPPPPPEVMAELPDIPENVSLREALELHNVPECQACHSMVDPIGFAFEFYDAIGQYRTLDNGVPIDASGDIEGIGTWQDAAGLASLLAEDPRTMNCLIRNMIRGQLGHIDGPGEAPGVDMLNAAFSSSGYSIKTLLVEMAVSPIFRLVDEPK